MQIQKQSVYSYRFEVADDEYGHNKVVRYVFGRWNNGNSQWNGIFAPDFSHKLFQLPRLNTQLNIPEYIISKYPKTRLYDIIMAALVFFNAALLLLQLLCNFIQIDTFCFFILRLVWNNELAIWAIIFIHYSVRKEQQKTVKTDIFAY